MSDISCRIVIDERYEAELNRLRIERNAAWRENAKLRELIRHMWRCMNNEYTEIGLDFICARCGECEYDNGTGECDFEQRITELGEGMAE